MTTFAVRPHTKLAAALLAAGVVSASSVVSMPADRALPTISADVAHTSAVTDFFVGIGQGVEVLTALVGIHVDATISLPFEATLAILAAAQHPELGDNVLSFLVQRFVNPAVGDPIHAYPWDTRLAVARLAELLPYPLGPSASGGGLLLWGSQAFADAFNSVLGQLPDPIPGFEAVQDVMNNTVLGGAVTAGLLLARAPLNIAWNTVNYLGYLPANIEASLESAIQAPDQIPGLVSHLVYGLLSPDPQIGLFGKVLNNIVDPFTWLPAPIAGLANQIRDIVAGVVNGVLSLLPAPVRPSALPSGAGPELGPRGGLSAGKNSVAPEAAPVPEVAEVPEVPEVEPTGSPSDTTFLRVRPSKVQVLDIPATDDVEEVVEVEEVEDEPDAIDVDKVDLDTVDADERDAGVNDAKTSDSGDTDSGKNDSSTASAADSHAGRPGSSPRSRTSLGGAESPSSERQ